MIYRILPTIAAVFILFSACCKKKHCTNSANTFTVSESAWINPDSILTQNHSVQVMFVNAQNVIDSFDVHAYNDLTSKAWCESVFCCETCTEDEPVSGTLRYDNITNRSPQDNLITFEITINKEKTGFSKGLYVNNTTFDEFDSLYAKQTIHNIEYDSVFVKVLDTLYQDVHKIWYSKSKGVLKYQLTNKDTWERILKAN
ncbi:MAG: hypothetical protein H7259_03145 [Cytophagales bacterium]|nr:hypothetical protein [Cytophaga sp.]